MALGISTSKIAEVIVVHLSGVIHFGKESASLRMQVKELLENSRQIVLDLRSVTSIDSGGLGTLVGLFASARKVGGEIKLAVVSRHAKEVLQITKLVTIFEIFELKAQPHLSRQPRLSLDRSRAADRWLRRTL